MSLHEILWNRFPWNPYGYYETPNESPNMMQGSSSLPRLNLRATLRPCSSFAGWDSKKSWHFFHIRWGHVHLMGYTRKTGKWAGMCVNIPENGLECSAKNMGICSCIPKLETRGTTFSGHFVVFNIAVRGVSNLDSYQHRDCGWMEPSGKQTWFAGESPFGLWFSHSKYSNAHRKTGFPIAMYLD